LQSDRAIGDQWLITSGLKPGDRVIVEGTQFAPPGSKVDPHEYLAPPSRADLQSGRSGNQN
jgi:membrane fusion protein (multidrug efflux system)